MTGRKEDWEFLLFVSEEPRTALEIAHSMLKVYDSPVHKRLDKLVLKGLVKKERRGRTDYYSIVLRNETKEEKL